MTSADAGADRERHSDLAGGALVVDADDALVLLHLLSTFERLLRGGNLTDHQLSLLTPEGTGPPHAADDLMMAQVVAEAVDALRSQLDEP